MATVIESTLSTMSMQKVTEASAIPSPPGLDPVHSKKAFLPPPGFEHIPSKKAFSPPPGLELFVEEQTTKPEDSPQKKGTEGLATMMRELGKSPTRRVQAHATTAEILLELVTIASQLAHVDAMLDSLRGSVPKESSEAEQWCNFSLEALAWSRKSLAEDQLALVKHLAVISGAHTSSGQSEDLDDCKVLKSGAVEDDACSTTASTTEPELPDSPSMGTRTPNSCATPVAADSAPEADTAMSLKLTLERIKEVCPKKALIVRKIKTLGFESSELLQQHFTKYGNVEEVLVSHSITKPSAKRTKGRVRPAAMGFVVMATVEDAEKVLAAGGSQTVHLDAGDVQVEVLPFQDNSSTCDED